MRGIKVPETPGFVSDVSGTFGIWGLLGILWIEKGFQL